jgi:hypothetical protein
MVSGTIGCADDEEPKDVIEVATVLGMVAVEVSEVTKESIDVAKVPDNMEPWRVVAFVSVPIWLLAWSGSVRGGWDPRFIDRLAVQSE